MRKDLAFLIAIGCIVLFFASFFLFRMLGKQEQLTVDEIHKQNVYGEIEEEENAYTYNGFSFVRLEGLWFTQLTVPGSSNLYNIQLHYGPREVDDLAISGEVKKFLQYPSLYVTFDPLGRDLSSVALAAGELSLNTAVVLNITPTASCTRNETEICKKLKIITCEDQQYPVVYLREAPRTGIVAEENCLTISGTGQDLVKATDRLLLEWMGIMK